MTDSSQQDFISLLYDTVCYMFETIPPWIWLVFAVCVFFSAFNSLLGSFLGDCPVLFGGFGSLIKRKFIDLMCKTNWGFKLMYKLGWAEHCVHFFDCGQDCHLCPKYADCSSELRKSSNT